MHHIQRILLVLLIMLRATYRCDIGQSHRYSFDKRLRSSTANTPVRFQSNVTNPKPNCWLRDLARRFIGYWSAVISQMTRMIQRPRNSYGRYRFLGERFFTYNSEIIGFLYSLIKETPTGQLVEYFKFRGDEHNYNLRSSDNISTRTIHIHLGIGTTTHYTRATLWNKLPIEIT